jgi:hypothetical protein
MHHSFIPGHPRALPLALVAALAGPTSAAFAQSGNIEEIQITSRRRTELAQEVPIPVTVSPLQDRTSSAS